MENLSPIQTGFMIRPREVKTCPRCSSYFITEKKCEDCGFVPFEERLGAPFGERSFYTLKENYWLSAPAWMRRFPKLENKQSRPAKEYKRVLLLRYKHLLDYFATSTGPHPHRIHFYNELKFLVDELLDYPISYDLLIQSLPHLKDERMNPIFEEIVREISFRKSRPKKDLASSFGGSWNLNFVVFIAMICSMSLAALSLFPYLVR